MKKKNNEIITISNLDERELNEKFFRTSKPFTNGFRAGCCTIYRDSEISDELTKIASKKLGININYFDEIGILQSDCEDYCKIDYHKPSVEVMHYNNLLTAAKSLSGKLSKDCQSSNYWNVRLDDSKAVESESNLSEYISRITAQRDYYSNILKNLDLTVDRDMACFGIRSSIIRRRDHISDFLKFFKKCKNTWKKGLYLRIPLLDRYYYYLPKFDISEIVVCEEWEKSSCTDNNYLFLKIDDKLLSDVLGFINPNVRIKRNYKLLKEKLKDAINEDGGYMLESQLRVIGGYLVSGVEYKPKEKLKTISNKYLNLSDDISTNVCCLSRRAILSEFVDFVSKEDFKGRKHIYGLGNTLSMVCGETEIPNEMAESFVRLKFISEVDKEKYYCIEII